MSRSGTERNAGNGDSQLHSSQHVQELEIGDKVWYWKDGYAIEADIQHIDRKEEGQFHFTINPTESNQGENTRTINTFENHLEKFTIQWPTPEDPNTLRNSGPFVVGSVAVYTREERVRLKGVVTQVEDKFYMFHIFGSTEKIEVPRQKNDNPKHDKNQEEIDTVNTATQQQPQNVQRNRDSDNNWEQKLLGIQAEETRSSNETWSSAAVGSSMVGGA
eukprot:3905467-Rhodomonas_salina.1